MCSLTLNICNALGQDLLQCLWVLKLLLDLGNESLGQLLLFSLLYLSFVSDPAVENLFGFTSKVGSLLKFKSLCLEFGSLLNGHDVY